MLSVTCAEASTEAARTLSQSGRQPNTNSPQRPWSGITGTTNLLATFTNSNPLTVANPLQSLWLNGVDIVDMLDYGYWTLTPNTAATGGTFSLSLSQRGHTNVAGRTGFTPLSRTSVGNDWQTLGNSVSGSLVSGTVTTVRSGLSDFMDFGIGIAEQPKSMVFLNSSLISGTAGQVGAIYKFPNVTTGIDAWVTLMDKEGGRHTFRRRQLHGRERL